MTVKRKPLKKAKKQLYFVRLPDVNLDIVGYNGAGREAVTEASSELDAVGHVAARFTCGGQVGLVSHLLDKVSERGRAEYACVIPEIEDKYSDGKMVSFKEKRWLRELAFAESLALHVGRGEHPNNYVEEARRIFDKFGI